MKVRCFFAIIVCLLFFGAGAMDDQVLEIHEQIMLSCWQAGHYRSMMTSLPKGKKNKQTISCIVFLKNKLDIVLVMREYNWSIYNADLVFYVGDVYTTLWQRISQDTFITESAPQCSISYEMRANCRTYAMKLAPEITPYSSLLYGCYPDFSMMACVDTKSCVLLELYKKPLVQMMRQLNDVSFCFASVD